MAIDDFGKKIGGAKKDLWKERGLALEDLLDFNAAERTKFIKKDNVWKKPDYQKMVDDGLDKRVVYFIKLVRDSLPTIPQITYKDTTDEDINAKQEGFISFVGKMRDAAMAIQTEADVKAFYSQIVSSYLIKKPYSYHVEVLPEAYDCINNKLLKCAQLAERGLRSFDRDVTKKQFCYSEDEKILAPYQFYLYQKSRVTFTKDYHDRDQIAFSYGYGSTKYFYPDKKWMNPEEWKEDAFFITKGSQLVERNFASVDEAKQFILASVKEKLAGKSDVTPAASKGKQRRKAFLPKQLEWIKREGPEVRKDIAVTGQDYLNILGFRGGEFGNWLNEKDRQASLDFGYEAFLDLSRALGISPTDLSLGGHLSIAFGARGHGDALAHYEPLREVINLTKMKGAGSLAHEWAHALDDIIGKGLGLNGMISKNPSNKSIPETFRKLIHSLQYKMASDDVATESQKKAAEKYASSVRGYLDRFFTTNMEETWTKEKDALIDALISSASGNREKCSKGIFYGQGYPEIDALSDFRKEVCGHVISKQDRIQIAHYMNALRSKTELIGTQKEIPTDFYLNSKKFDDVHSKTDHGYWQSASEMFARAFACYVNDKLKDMGERSDYLCGHSDVAVSLSADRDGNLVVIKAFPEGEEREMINRNFDSLFEELKTMELLHPLEQMPTLSSLENYKEDRKVSLDIQILGAKERKEKGTMDTQKRIEPKFYEKQNGQIGFVFD